MAEQRAFDVDQVADAPHAGQVALGVFGGEIYANDEDRAPDLCRDREVPRPKSCKSPSRPQSRADNLASRWEPACDAGHKGV